MQKAVFLVGQRGPTAWQDLYPYRPYHWGPYSRELAADLESLVDLTLLDLVPRADRRYDAYRATPTGDAWADLQFGTEPPAYLIFIGAVRQFVTNRSFSQLLRDVYAEFPDFASRSRFTG
jgi:hypothetical protein